MNFLAHLHLASLAESSLLGNILADFVRGSPDDDWSPEIVAGIYMHRRVDALTDGLPQVRTALEWFRPETRRVAPIALDVMWDHFLSRHWKQLAPEVDLPDFIDRARQDILPALDTAPARFVTLNQHIWTERWLERYADMSFIANVLNGMASRRPKLDALRHSWSDLDAHYEQLERQFWSFYPEMMAQARKQQL
ncbi:acyl carrier protein phosphodiesterase [Salmonella enterica subsp. enterica serovar Choleraesuis]|nr:acyl carrier protein phosphodiesterase [Salmonella enterica subsp. enterica serovar Choleraesuis]